MVWGIRREAACKQGCRQGSRLALSKDQGRQGKPPNTDRGERWMFRICSAREGRVAMACRGAKQPLPVCCLLRLLQL